MTGRYYPTSEELETIRTWSVLDPMGLVIYVRQLWPRFGSTRLHRVITSLGVPYREWTLYTGRWSANHDILCALRLNREFWLAFFWSDKPGVVEFRIEESLV